MARGNKPAWLIYRGRRPIDCQYIRSVAVKEVDRVYGKGYFTRPWVGNRRGDYEIVPCECEYDAVYIVDSGMKHSPENPTAFPSLDALADYIKERGLKVRRKDTRYKRFAITTDKGIIRGRIMNVK